MIDRDEFLRAAVIPRDGAHSGGSLEPARALLNGDPSLSTRDIFTACVVGDASFVHRHVAEHPDDVTRKAGPYNWDPLTHLCFSLFLQHDPDSGDFVGCARILLDAGASANTGFFEGEHQPKPEWESVLYGAAGVAHHPELTRLLIERGADVNDVEVVYHSPESYDNRAMQEIVRTGRVEPVNLTLMLLRKIDWHDFDGVRWMLENGADPNGVWVNGAPPFHFAILRDDGIETIALLLRQGADPNAPTHVGTRKEFVVVSGIELAARCGRADVLRLLESRGVSIAMTGVAEVAARCALGDLEGARAVLDGDPAVTDQLQRDASALLTRFALTGNTDGVRALLDLGLDPSTTAVPGVRFADGDGYWDIAKQSTPLHTAAWRAHHDVVQVLIERGADVNARDARDRSPLMRAVAAATNSYWMQRRSDRSIRMLLDAGADASGVAYPTGYADADALLASRFNSR